MERDKSMPVAVSDYDAEPGVESAAANLYTGLARSVQEVKGVYVDTAHGLTIYTVYEGDRRAIQDRLYNLYGTVMDRFPNLPIDFRILDAARLASIPVPAAAQAVFVR